MATVAQASQGRPEDNSSPQPVPDQFPQTNDQAIVLSQNQRNTASRGWFTRRSAAILSLSVAALTTPFLRVGSLLQPAQQPIDPTDYYARTRNVLSTTPLIDGHNDLPYLIHVEMRNKLYDGLDLRQKLLGHTDIQRLKKGMVGGQWWSVYIDCPDVKSIHEPTFAVRDTLETIDIAKRMIDQYNDTLAYCDNAACVRTAFASGKIASMIGIEGAHQVGDSLGAIRQMYSLGARYITTTHNCDNAFATSTSTVAAGGVDKGLTKFGLEYVKEMNRLGMLIDLSHVSHQTMRDVLSVTRAPIIFSHSGAYTVQKHLRHVPDDVLRSVKRNGGIVMATFVNRFLNMKNPDSASIHDVVDHIFHIADIAGWEHVGVGGDFSGTPATPIGLEDVSKYPDLVQLLMERGATDEQIRLFAGENFIRVWTEVENVGKQIQAEGALPNEANWEERRWMNGYAGLPFMYADSKERLALSFQKAGAYQFNVDQKSGTHEGGK